MQKSENKKIVLTKSKNKNVLTIPWHYCGHYQNAGIIRGRALYEEIRYVQKEIKIFFGVDTTHCYSIRSNLKTMGPLQLCLPVFLGIHRNPKQKEFFNSHKGFLR